MWKGFLFFWLFWGCLKVIDRDIDFFIYLCWGNVGFLGNFYFSGGDRYC